MAKVPKVPGVCLWCGRSFEKGLLKKPPKHWMDYCCGLHKETHLAALRRRRWYERHGEKQRCRVMTNWLIKTGKLVLDLSKCSKCGVACRAEKHHPDYSKPELVVPLCGMCHHEEHGETNPISRNILAKEKRNEVRSAPPSHPR